MKIVVSGASGHIGKATCALLSEKHEVVGFDSKQIDLTSDEAVPAVSKLLEGADVLVHLAAWHPPATAATTAADRRKLLDVNVMGTMRVLEAARGGRVKAVVYASSFEVYGTPESLSIDEEHPTRPLSDYGATKLAGEDHLLAFAYEESTRVVALRMPAVYGPGEKTPRLLPNCLAKVARGERPVIEGDGEDLRDELHVADAALAVRLAAEQGVQGIFNVADGREHSVAEVARTAMKVAGLSGEPDRAPRKKPRLDYHMSIERARTALGFSPRVSLEEGMRQQLEHLKRSL